MENMEHISLEELREILKTKGLDIKELAKEAKKLKQILANNTDCEDAVKNGSSKPRSKSNQPVFELVLASYPDFVIRKSTSKTEKMLVFMLSQNSYYIKTVRNGSETTEPLNGDNYTQFTSGMKESIKLPNDFWIDYIKPGRPFFSILKTRFMLNSYIRKAIIEKYYIKRDNYYLNDNYSFDKICDAYEKIPKLMNQTDVFKPIYLNFWQILYFIQKKFGLDNARDFVKELDISLISVGSNMNSTYFYNILEKFDFKYASFKDYVLYDSVRLGFGNNLGQFVSIWYDTLRMEVLLYGNVKDKYPKYLADYHNQLAYQYSMRRTRGNDELIKDNYNLNKKLEAEIGDYVFMIPKTSQDIYDEAVQMCNCLASYIERYVAGNDYIVFMRKKESPDLSLVTIELDLDGNLRQAYQERNTQITNTQREVIEEWLTKIVKSKFKKGRINNDQNS